MKLVTKEDIDSKFNQAIEACDIPDIEASILGVLAGSLYLSIKERISQLKSGVSQSNDCKNEITRLQNALGCLNEKINNTNASAFKQEFKQAHKAYVNLH
jgi:hypothetical protein